MPNCSGEQAFIGITIYRAAGGVALQRGWCPWRNAVQVVMRIQREKAKLRKKEMRHSSSSWDNAIKGHIHMTSALRGRERVGQNKGGYVNIVLTRGGREEVNNPKKN